MSHENGYALLTHDQQISRHIVTRHKREKDMLESLSPVIICKNSVESAPWSRWRAYYYVLRRLILDLSFDTMLH